MVLYITQILVSKHTRKLYFEPYWIPSIVSLKWSHYTREEIIKEIEIGVNKHFEFRDSVTTKTKCY